MERHAMPIDTLEDWTPRLAPSAFVHAGAWIIGEVSVGDEASIWPSAVLRGDQGSITVGARTSFQDGCVAHGTVDRSRTAIGAECTIGHRSVLHGCTVADHCLVGMGSVLLDNATLGEWCFVGASALITPGQAFPPRSFILGHPARRVREVTAQEMEWIEFSWRTYRDLARRYQAQSAPSR